MFFSLGIVPFDLPVPDVKDGAPQRINQNVFVLTLLELQSRFGDTPVKFQVVCPKLSPKRDCSPKRVKRATESWRAYMVHIFLETILVVVFEPPGKEECEIVSVSGIPILVRHRWWYRARPVTT